MINQEELTQMIEDCEQRESKLSDWERGFISNLGDVIDKGYRVSEAQIEILEGIWEKIT